MNLDIDASIERLIADDFQAPPLISGQVFIEKLGEAFRDHNGKWPTYATASFGQARRWEMDLLQARQRLALDETQPRQLKIMNVRIIERPGPITLIWSERL